MTESTFLDPHSAGPSVFAGIPTGESGFSLFFHQAQFPMAICSTEGHIIQKNLAWDTFFQEGFPESTWSSYFQQNQMAPLRYSETKWLELMRSPWADYQLILVKDVTDKVETEHALIHSLAEKRSSENDQKFLSQASELLNVSFDYREILRSLCDHAIKYFCDGVFVDQLLPDGKMKRLLVVHKDPATVKKLEKLDTDFPDRYDNNPLMNPLITGVPFYIEDADAFWNQARGTQDQQYVDAAINIGTQSSIRVRLKGRESVLGIITFFTSKNSTMKLTKRHLWLAEDLSYRASMAFENALIHQASEDAIRSRDEFLSIASHELKTPLQSLTLQNQMRKRNIDKKLNITYSPEKMSQMIEADLRHLTRINRLIDDMLDISRIRAGRLNFINERVEFNSFVVDVIDRFRPQVEALGCYLTSNIPKTEMFTEIDIYRMEQVLVNLLTNAMKYGAGKPIKVDVLKKNDRIQVLVHDQGPGIREEDHERIFERFERAISSSEVSGLGLGLYISRQIMEHNGGCLSLRSTLGQGSTFIMDLPYKS